MTPELVIAVLQMRVAVGLLGEQGPKAWWSSTFLSTASRPFLSPIFPRTLGLGQLHGVVAAAARVHDERIGTGNVYHLFRLTEETEQAADQFMRTAKASSILADSAADPACAAASLARFATEPNTNTPGPVRIAGAEQIDDMAAWKRIAGHYAYGFGSRIEVYPFFSAK